MKLKTNIARLLATGLLLNNIYFYSNANTLDDEIPGRYETLEGEYITIDDSMEGNLEEIEVFGNTIQDPNNLEDIQSVGDLYVDEDGNPILDKQGKEQYKIDLISYDTPNGMRNIQGLGDRHKRLDYNTFTITNVNGDGSVFSNYTGIYFKADNIDESLIGKQMKIKFKLLELSGDESLINPTVPPYKWNGNGTERFNLTLNKEQTRIVNITKTTPNTPLFVFEVKPTSSPMYAKAQVEVIVLDDTYNENVTSIFLPCQLQKLGDIADRLYWDNEKRKYVIEKNIGICSFDNKFSISNFNTYDISGYRAQYFSRSDFPQFNVKDGFFSQYKYLSDKFLIGSNNPISEEIYIKMGNNDLRICVRNDLFDSLTLEEVRNLFLGAKIYYPKKDVESIETNITSKLKVPTYEKEIHIFIETENRINPNLKVVVDRLSQIAKNAIEEAENDSTSYNISLARMYVNMLPESLYKDQLQEQLSQVFSSDITLDRKTAASNLDIYVKSENMLSLSLDTNSVTFENYSGVEDTEMLGAVNININSSLPYSLNAYMPIEITNSDKSNILPVNLLNIKESSESNYKQFANTTDKIVLKDSCNAGNNSIHNIDLKLSSNQAHKADVYKTVIKFEAEQK